jgi:hypothetical protein
VRSELVDGAGWQFDPDVTSTALAWLEKRIARRRRRSGLLM